MSTASSIVFLLVCVLLSVLENWFAMCLSCVKWGSVTSRFYELKTGVRQGGVLSPYLFSIFIDDLVKYVNKASVGCRIHAICTAIFLYADDVILLAPSVSALQVLVGICAAELEFLDMAINVKNRHVCSSVKDIEILVAKLLHQVILSNGWSRLNTLVYFYEFNQIQMLFL